MEETTEETTEKSLNKSNQENPKGEQERTTTFPSKDDEGPVKIPEYLIERHSVKELYEKACVYLRVIEDQEKQIKEAEILLENLIGEDPSERSRVLKEKLERQKQEIKRLHDQLREERKNKSHASNKS